MSPCIADLVERMATPLEYAFITQLPSIATAAASSGLSERAVELNKCFLSFISGRPPLAELVVGCKQYLEYAEGGSVLSPSGLEAACQQFLDGASRAKKRKREAPERFERWHLSRGDEIFGTFNLVLVGGAACHKCHWISRHAKGIVPEGPTFSETVVSGVKVHRLEFWTNRGLCVINLSDVGDMPQSPWSPSRHPRCPPETRSRVRAALLCHSRPESPLSLLPRVLLTEALEYLPAQEHGISMENIHSSWSTFEGAIVMSNSYSSTSASVSASPCSFAPTLKGDIKRICGDIPTALVNVRNGPDVHDEEKEEIQSNRVARFEISTECCSSKFCLDQCPNPNEAPFLWLVRAMAADPQIVFEEEPAFCVMPPEPPLDDATRARYEAELQQAALQPLPDDDDPDL